MTRATSSRSTPDRNSAALSQQQQLIAALRNPQCYPHPGKTVRLIETHISWVLLIGRYAYKIKKALDLGFLDATRLASRHAYCREEIRLNRRLAPQLYLDVVAIGGTSSHPEWDTRPAIEYAVRMRRFAAAKTLDKLIVRNKLAAVHMHKLANTLADFHADLPAATDIASADFAHNVHAALTQNFSQLAGLLADAADIATLATLQSASVQAYARHRHHIAQRCTQGFVRECHGDLHLGNIVLIGDQPTPFDGIDFNLALRRIDVIDEVAFLFMDLLHHRQPQLAYCFLNSYLEQSGDYAGVDLLNFYCAYRAMVRAKINAIRAGQAAVAPRVRSATQSACRSYMHLAGACLAPRTPRLLITHGLPGSGKSMFAQAALQRFNAIRLRSDVERKRLFGLSALADSRTGQNIYSAEATQRTYARLFNLARGLLHAGHTVIVDAAFLKQQEREMFRKLADELHVPFAIASMQADAATLRTRIRQRQKLGNDASEADLEVLQKLLTAQETLTAQELHCSQVFSNTRDMPLDESAWSGLEALLRGRAPSL
jgi:aminoglycoside phosphotransferase family enzyme/predicted kinase